MKEDIRMNLVTPRVDESVFLERAVNKRHFVTQSPCGKGTMTRSRLSAILVHAYEGHYTHSAMFRSAGACSATVHRIENGHVETIDCRFF
jgi:hypothetical protein